MMSLHLPHQDTQTLTQIEIRYGSPATEITVGWIHAVLQYYRTHDQLPFFASEVRTCQGCTYLRPPEELSHLPPNVIPLQAPV